MCERHISPLTTTPRRAAAPNSSPTVGPVRAHPLVGVAAPVGEEQVVARLEGPDLLDQPREVRGAVDEGTTAFPADHGGRRKAGLPRSAVLISHSSTATR